MSDVLNSLKKKNNKDEGQGKRLQEQLNTYFLKELKHFVVEKRLSYLCGFTKNYSGQYTYFSWKKKGKLQKTFGQGMQNKDDTNGHFQCFWDNKIQLTIVKITWI